MLSGIELIFFIVAVNGAMFLICDESSAGSTGVF